MKEIIKNGKITMTPRQVADLLHSELGTPREELVLTVLRYTIDKEGVLRNPRGKAVGSLNNRGYQKIQVTIGGKARDVFTHRLQAFSKYGKELFKEGIQVRHLNDIKKDNSWDNIALGTAKDNHEDRGQEAIKAAQKIATDASRKYSDELILEAKQYFDKCQNLKQTSIKYNIPSTTLHYRFYGKKKQDR